VEDAPLAATAAAHDNPVETRYLVVEPMPYPAADIFERRHLQPGDFIQVIVVEYGAKLGDVPLDFGEIAQPVLRPVWFAPEEDLHLERVTVKPGIMMAIADVYREVMGGLEGKFLENLEHLRSGPKSASMLAWCR
jgi:hypothetical protein